MSLLVSTLILQDALPTTTTLQPPAAPPVTFSWVKVPNMTICDPATINWKYSGPQQDLLISTSSGDNLSFSVDAALQTYTIPSINLNPGEYTMSASGSQVRLASGSHMDTSFTVSGRTTPCLDVRAPVLDDTGDSTSSSSTNKAAMFGGIAVGVGGFIALVTAGIYLPWKRLFNRVRKPDSESLDVPGYEGQWDNLPSRNVSTSFSGSERRARNLTTTMSDTATMTDINPSLVTLPRLEPNRRPPSTVLDAAVNVRHEPVPAMPVPQRMPMAKLEPNRRKPSVAGLDVPGHDARASVPVPPVPSPAVPPPPKVDLEAEFKPIKIVPPVARPVPALDVPILAVPHPGRRATRQSAISAYTSASTALSDMPLLNPGVRTPRQIEAQRTLALLKLGASKDHEPIPPRRPAPLPIATPSPPPPPSPPSSTSPQSTSSSTKASPSSPTPSPPSSPSTSRTPPSASATLATMRTPTLLRSPTTPSLRSPHSPGPRPLQRSGSARSTSSRRKPVPPLDQTSPSEGASLWTRQSYASPTWEGRGGSLPSSTTSRMYGRRDSINSDWTATWSRPLEDWEHEQMRVLSNPLTNPNVIEEMLEKAVPLPDSSRRYVGASLGRGAGLSESRRGLQVMRHQSMGEMKSMRSVIPDVPPLPSNIV